MFSNETGAIWTSDPTILGRGEGLVAVLNESLIPPIPDTPDEMSARIVQLERELDAQKRTNSNLTRALKENKENFSATIQSLTEHCAELEADVCGLVQRREGLALTKEHVELLEGIPALMDLVECQSAELLAEKQKNGELQTKYAAITRELDCYKAHYGVLAIPPSHDASAALLFHGASGTTLIDSDPEPTS